MHMKCIYKYMVNRTNDNSSHQSVHNSYYHSEIILNYNIKIVNNPYYPLKQPYRLWGAIVVTENMNTIYILLK